VNAACSVVGPPDNGRVPTAHGLGDVRRVFPVTDKWLYFNHAATGPMPSTTVQAMNEFAARVAEDGEVPYPEAEAMVEECRERVGRLLHVSPDSVAFTSNTSAGIIIPLSSVDWRPGDNVILLEDDFPTVTYPFDLMLPDVEKRRVHSEELVSNPGALLELADDRTRMVAVSWVHFLTGRRFDVAAIVRFCRERGIVSVIDAIQGMGVVDCDWRSIDADFVAGHGAKWMLSPQGTGILLVRRETAARLRPVNLGWLSADWKEFNDIFSVKPLKPGAARYEAGTKNYIGICGMNASLKFWDGHGTAGMEVRIRALDARLRAGLEAAGFELVTPVEPERSGCMVTCRHPEICPLCIHAWLKEAKMVCAVRENLLRVSPHFYNTEGEVDRFLERISDPRAAEAKPSDCKT
jgi:cysteine desulfurase/selenocysteine lyase